MLYHYTSLDALQSILKEPATDKGLCFWATRFDCFGDKEEYKLGIETIKRLLPKLEKRLQPDRRIASSFKWNEILGNSTGDLGCQWQSADAQCGKEPLAFAAVLEEGSVLFEAKDGAYSPLEEGDMLEV